MSSGHSIEDFFPGHPNPPRINIRNTPPPPAHEARREPEDLAAALTPLAAELAGRTVLGITGAGISTDSGIPDYRSPGSTPRTPITIQQFMASAARRQNWWARNQLGWRNQLSAAPNPGHRALAQLEQGGVVNGVITQNIDRLHARAGTTALVELHGRYDVVLCASCPARYTREEVGVWLDQVNPNWMWHYLEDIEVAPDADAVLAATDDFNVVACPQCGGILRPDVVFFGGSVPPERVTAAYQLTDQAEAILVAGTSLAVASALRFVRHAHEDGKLIVIVNRGATRADDLARLRAHVSTSRALPWLAAELLP